MKQLDATVIIFSYCWPSHYGGDGIAARSTLLQCLRLFKHVHFIGLVDVPFVEQDRWSDYSITWTHIPVIKTPPWQRFLRSVFSPLPAITMQFRQRRVIEKVLECLRAYETSKSTLLIFEDIHTGCLLPLIRHMLPSAPVAIRSQNVNAIAFASFCTKGNLVSRLAWWIEVSKIRRFEKEVCLSADRVWAISEIDQQNYSKNLGIECDGIFGVSLDPTRYMHIGEGDPFTVLYIGSTDIRKRKGIAAFIDSAWREVHAAYPSARFLLAGSGTQSFTQEEFGVYGEGFCSDERDFLGKGMIFVNPQEDGSGVKLKSIVAMLSGKALVSTKTGVEGLLARSDDHFLVGDDSKSLASLLIRLLETPTLALNMGRRSQSHAAAIYTDDHLSETAQPLLSDLASLL